MCRATGFKLEKPRPQFVTCRRQAAGLGRSEVLFAAKLCLCMLHRA